ncbi:hypothetical protein [Sphingobacterium bovistauri]|uniref:Uncharacterized protein n=1 Tax=Sphingobacterium bovistauri TaxID=2781959 RepID=A0ABS7Z230_9SPHI|nr:hypothetical protein [Sphingobacterium bovistauri]MCA5004236.1 hypothetical protein [Sphingobacterium bovistauri]
MNKQNYKCPQVHLISVEIEESISTGSTNTYYITPTENRVDIVDYEVFDEQNKDFNINF